MPRQIPTDFLDLFERKSFAHLATVNANGTPQVTPVWIDYDGEHVLVNSARGRVKDRNMEERPNVALTVIDPDDPYRYLAIQGKVVGITEEGAREHINKLSGRYRGQPVYSGPSDQIRVIYKILPEKVFASGKRKLQPQSAQ